MHSHIDSTTCLKPILALMYLCNALDKGNLGNAKTDHMDTDLGFVGNQYNILLSVFYVPVRLSMNIWQFNPFFLVRSLRLPSRSLRETIRPCQRFAHHDVFIWVYDPHCFRGPKFCEFVSHCGKISY